MTTLNFDDSLKDNPFTYSNEFTYTNIRSSGLYFSDRSENYPFIMKGEKSDDFELEYSVYNYQLRGRLLNTKRIKEVMDKSRLPLLFLLKSKHYLIGKGFLCEFTRAKPGLLLFMACVNGSRKTKSMEEVRFFISKKIYDEEYKIFHPVIKDLVAGHPGDILMVNDILCYTGGKIPLPKGGNLSDVKKHKEIVVKSALSKALRKEVSV